mmetsp:Transcript_24580/g.80308  ORF Transcript_24580/g.80308 Transcript_24580/m.80308 type:complete len:433 (+) Transcript_24580:2002-3300(+)
MHLSLKVYVGRFVKIEDVHLRQPLRLPHKDARVRLHVHHRCEKPARHAFAAPELVVQCHHLVCAHGQPLPDEQVDVVDGEVLIQLVLDVALRILEQVCPVRVARARAAPRAHVARDVRRRDVRNGFDFGDGGVALVPGVAVHDKLELLRVPPHLEQVFRAPRNVRSVHDALDSLLIFLFQRVQEVLVPERRHAQRHSRLILFARELEAVEHPLLAQVVQIVAPLLRDVQVHSLAAHNVRRRCVVIVENAPHDALVDEHHERNFAHPRVHLTRVALLTRNAPRKERDEIKQTRVVATQLLELFEVVGIPGRTHIARLVLLVAIAARRLLGRIWFDVGLLPSCHKSTCKRRLHRVLHFGLARVVLLHLLHLFVANLELCRHHNVCKPILPRLLVARGNGSGSHVAEHAVLHLAPHVRFSSRNWALSFGGAAAIA